MFHILKPLYLIGLSLASIPLILHLLGRRRIREQPFSTLFLLKEIKKSSSVWMRIKDLILLVLRMLFILLAVLAFSHPLMLSPVPFFGKAAPRDVAILIDVSMSMGAQGVLENAQREAISFVDQLSADNRLLLISFTDRIEDEQEILTKSEAFDLINNLQVTYRSTDLLPALQRAEKHLATKDGFIKEIIIISDFAKSGIQNVAPVASKIAKGGIATYAAFIRGSEHNTYFPDWSMEPPFPLQGMRVALHPKLMSSRTIPQPVELFVKGTMRGTKKTTPKSEIAFEMELRSAGYQWGHFRIRGDSLHMDNNHYFAYHVPQYLNVLLVRKGNEHAFISAALKPGIETPIKLNTVTPSELVKTNPLQYDLLILYNVLLEGAAKARVMDYLSNGGGVLYIAGNTTTALIGRKILNTVEVVRKNDAETGFFAIKTVDTGFPPFSDFRNKGLKNLNDTRIYRYFTFSSRLDPIITAKNGDPLVLSGKVHNGKVVVFAFALDSDWSQLPLKAIFVPVLYRLTFHLAAKQEQLPHYTVGDAIRMVCVKKRKNPVFVLPGGDTKSATETENAYVLRNTELPGIYTFVPQPEESIPVAVNVDAAESNLEKLSFEELKQLLPGIQLSEKTLLSAS